MVFDGRKCIHSRNCVLGRPDVFVPNVEGEWIHPHNASVAELAELAHNCPSGAIRCTDLQGKDLEHAPVVNTVRVRDGPLTVEPTVDGPLHITGNLEVVTGTGKTVDRVTETWMCRCGHSQNKPFCDGSHRKAGFKSEQ